MFENIGLNLNNFNQYMCSNPILSGCQSFSMYSNPFMGGFNFSGDIASMGLFSGMNYASYTNFLTPMTLPYNYMLNWGSTALPIEPSLAAAYNGFVGNGAYSMPFLNQTSTPKFKFSATPAASSSLTSLWNSYKSQTTSSKTTSAPASSSSSRTTTSSSASATVKRYGKDLSPEFINKTKQIAMKLNCNYDDLLAVMNSESGLNPQACNKSSGASGLIQFTAPAIQQMNRKYGLNLTAAKIRNMSAIEQLDLVEKYLSMCKTMAFSSNARLSAADLYSLIFLPGRASRDTLTQRGEAYYNANKGLDKNGDGKITKNDLAQHLNTKRVSLVA